MQPMDTIQTVLVEDDRKLAGILNEYLTAQGIDIVCVTDGREAVDVILTRQPHLVLLDLMLPGMDGLSVCRALRPRYTGRILFLTASDDDMDQVAALELGADDFVVKPIQPRVLLARIRMLIRRQKPTDNQFPDQPDVRQYGHLTLHGSRRQCLLDGESVVLSDGEFEVLWLLANHPDEVVTREFLVRQTRGIDYDGLDRTVDNKIASLRRKLGDSAHLPRRIITVRGKGYLFVPDTWNQPREYL